MGVPALFRWLSKKYPKIIYPVEEEADTKILGEGGENVAVPINMALPNPNGMEFDNLYLDMNGIVHPCTHPDGKPAPETEEEMMVAIFTYTERVVSMIRPRKLLFMAIDGVAPRAKMNEQRSRRFRSAREAKAKEEARKESVLLWKAMGKEVLEEEKSKVSWDSNAITPGTPFMDLLASSLRYWVVQKMNTDPSWKNMQVIVSDAKVPGEGEHKIMDFIRRQRSNPSHDPNTKHVIYGLDADLIMLALATHEPNFRVLREDLFSNATSPTACRMCGQEGHYAAQCAGTKAEIQKKPPAEKKPFIFLDVAILREYLEVELEVPNLSFPFSFEKAIDDWVLLIFFIGNDFLPHIPSLEIREGAIDTLLKIWKQELPRMGGHLTNHGKLELSRAQIILESLAKREDEIFRRRREAKERQDQNAKYRKIELQQSPNDFAAGPSQTMALTAPLLGATTVRALAGSNHDVVANRRTIRMANISAAEVLKAELSGLSLVKRSASPFPAAAPIAPPTISPPDIQVAEVDSIPGFRAHTRQNRLSSALLPLSDRSEGTGESDADADGDLDPDVEMSSGDKESSNNLGADTEVLAGAKRKFEEGPASDDVVDEVIIEEDDDDAPLSLAMKVNPDGTVEQEDTVKLWEPGYRERYYRQKFSVELTDTEFRKQLTKSYVEGLSWVLHYYYQGTPSWQWYYPYHFAPFAADFEEVDKMDVQFKLGHPCKPFELLMGVLPAASRAHIPKVFHRLMTEEDSPIIDFYRPTFEIDMNGKKMVWQGVALLPFIDQQRLLDAMAVEYPNLTEDEVRRNRWGSNIIYASVDHPICPFYENLYGKRNSQEPVTIDTILSHGLSGSVLPNPDCVPRSTYYCPLNGQGLADIKNDRSLSVLYFVPKQLTPHRSVILPGTKRLAQVLSSNDLEVTRNGGRGHGRAGWDRGGERGGRGNGVGRSHNNPFHSRSNNYGPSYGNDRAGPWRRGSTGGYGEGGGGYGGRGGNSYQQNSYPSRAPYQSQPPSNSYGNFAGYRARGGYGGDSSRQRGFSNGYNSYSRGNRGGYNAPASQNPYSLHGSDGAGYGSYGSYGSGKNSGPPPSDGVPYDGTTSRGKGRT